ncbi:RES domain-containing protein [Rhodobacter sp. Har01]|uniref:RES family NAD+ phosphorylase n=1 Tax=Rhodobacter sp. Har01 TaxID=2883999 RepID=UPI001D05EA0F|nr:RES domain-containing protein [Rhodobacter sp. Har01]MCB6177324.1 RES domain-containing protein [Rhodobacter sp. Har01]
MRLQAVVYRALNPVWVADPLSGEGARRHGGRFNPKGMAALYCTLDPVTAIREVSQIGQPLQPTILVSFQADIEPIFDATNPQALQARGLTAASLAANDWRAQMAAGGEAPTQTLARTLAAEGYAGLLAPSYARLAPPQARNLVLWRWTAETLRLIDDEARLSPKD